MRPLQYAVYKGKGSGRFGAAQFNLSDAHYYCESCKVKNWNSDQHPSPVCAGANEKLSSREGCIFLDITSAKAPDVYDWENKIIMALSVTDLSKLLITLRTGSECKLFHDPGAGSEKMGAIKKTLNVSSPRGIETGCMIFATMSDGTNKKAHSVPMTFDECAALATLIQAAIPRCLNWS